MNAGRASETKNRREKSLYAQTLVNVHYAVNSVVPLRSFYTGRALCSDISFVLVLVQ